MVVETKICSCCSEPKPLNRFGIYKAAATGKVYNSNQCKDCANKKSRAYRAARPEVVKSWDSKRYEKGKPEILAQRKRHYAANKEEIAERGRRYRLKNGDHLRAQARAYHHRKGAEHREKDRIRSRAARAALKIEVLMAYGGTFCQCCNETCVDMLNLDHINNDGNVHRKGKTAGDTTAQMYRWARRNNYPPIFRVMCFNCNIARVRTIGNVCPHEIERLKLAA